MPTRTSVYSKYEMDSEYLGLVMLMTVAGIICAAMVTLSSILGPKKNTPYKSSPYECGVAPLGSARERFPIKFYLIAILFVLFDIEIVFLWGWMTSFKGGGADYMTFSFIAVLIYMFTWVLGDVYALRVNAIDWDESTALDPAKLGELADDEEDDDFVPRGVPALQPAGGAQ